MEITCTDGAYENPADGRWQIREETVKKVMHPGDALREILTRV